MKKIDFAIKHYEDLENILSCPFCQSQLTLKNHSLVCLKNHTFNISKKGTVILYKTSKMKENKIYNENLFINRRSFITGGFYEELHQKISNTINQYKVTTILDMGSGDGTHDVQISHRIKNKNVMIIGVDLAKKGIDLSNDYIDRNYIGIVSDLNHLPLKENSVDLILNILSPSNEKEIKRILKPNGLIIKVTPKKEYLQELRTSLNIKDYENEKIIESHIYSKYEVVKKEEIMNTYSIDDENLKYLFNMTPLMNHITHIPSIDFITIALNIYVLRIK